MMVFVGGVTYVQPQIDILQKQEKKQKQKQKQKIDKQRQKFCPEIKPQPKPKIPVAFKEREFVPPETIGLPKDFPGRVMKDKMVFKCECCGVMIQTRVYHPHLPECPRDGCYMREVE